MNSQLVELFGAALVTACAIPALARLAPRLGLLDHPDGTRKLHKGAIPLVGGPALLLALLAIALISGTTSSATLSPLLIAATAAIVLGALDDRFDLHAGGRLISQLLLAGFAVFIGGIAITHFGDLLGNGSNLPLNWLGGWIAVGALAAAMNAYNMLDGTDGQCAVLALVPTIALVFTSMNAGLPPPFVLCVLVGALPVFVFFNLHGRNGRLPKVFLGDSGATLLGLLVGWMLIEATQANGGWLRPTTALWLAAVPLFDTLFVMAYRMLHNRSPLAADRNHIHYLLADQGLNRLQVLACVSCVAVAMAATGVALEQLRLPEWLSFGLLGGLFLIYLPTAIHLHRRRDRHLTPSNVGLTDI